MTHVFRKLPVLLRNADVHGDDERIVREEARFRFRGYRHALEATVKSTVEEVERLYHHKWDLLPKRLTTQPGRVGEQGTIHRYYGVVECI